jgi:polar amino acid transport system substrate-binding protein
MKMLWIWAVALTLIALPSHAQDKRIADIAKAGELRFGIFKSQQISTVRPEIAAMLASRMKVKLRMIENEGPLEAIACVHSAKCHAAFLHRDERNRDILAFSYPLIYYEFSLLVPSGSAITKISDADNPKVRVVVIKGHASTSVFERMSKKSQKIPVEDHDQAADLVRSGKADAVASTRHSLGDIQRRLSGASILKEPYGLNVNRVAIPQGNLGRLAYVNEFVEDAKKSGQLQAAVDRDKTSGGFQVSEPGEAKTP